MKKGLKNLIKIICIIFLVYIILLGALYFMFLKSVDVDVAKRMKSPDGTKTALLIRRHAWIDLNFFVEIKDGMFPKDLHKSKDFLPDPHVDWNEELVWSYDSSLLVMSVDNPYDDEDKYVWAYDFKDNKEHTDEALITEILSSRNEGIENPAEARYKW